MPIMPHSIQSGKYAPTSEKEGAPCTVHPPSRRAELMPNGRMDKRSMAAKWYNFDKSVNQFSQRQEAHSERMGGR
ncbi:hypothetical protein AA14362_1754 [Acetobacter cerevisiae DSM 14362]|nr:hypothetical protein AA14362_1754 [Acetobacter cerevisiae DSM 14362]